MSCAVKFLHHGSRVASSGTTQTRYPLYDAHGNSVATLGRPTTTGGLPGLGDERSYDAWGRVRLGLTRRSVGSGR